MSKNDTTSGYEIMPFIENIVGYDGKINYDENQSIININNEKVNIIVAGKTGVGKSSLINYIFGEEVAEIGNGKPVTQEIEEYVMKKDNITLFDTKGIEAADYEDTLSNIKKFLEEKHNSVDENNHIHIAWLCISEAGGRIEEADKELLKILIDTGIPAIGVFTKMTPVKNSVFVNKVIEENMLPGVKNVIRIRNVEEKIELNDMEIKLSPRGAEELLDETYKNISEGRQNAIKKAQIVEIKDRIEVMSKEAAVTTNRYSAISAGIGMTPLPFADSIALAAIQTKLIIDINTIYRVDAGAHTFTDIAAALISITGIAQIGKMAAGFLKIIPGIGWAANGAVAAGITKGIGFGYSEYLKSRMDYKTGEIKLDLEDLKKNFMTFFEKFKKQEA